MPERPRRPSSSVRFLGRVFAYVFGLGALSGVAFARRNGIAATSCSGCHGSGATTQVRGSATPATFNPGDDVTITVTLARAGSKTGGIYVAEPPVGQLRALDQELQLVTGGLVHVTPKTANASGEVSFRFGWRAPSTKGAVRFEIAAVSTDGDGRSSGDASAQEVVSFTYGCAPQTFYADLDRDGYGSQLLSPIVDCEGPAPATYSTRDDDCDDAYDKAFPGATELCNDRDDDCDGVVDEGAPPVELWPDDDGDGFYGAPIGTPVVGCVPLAGYAADPGDCAPRDPKRFPGTTESCNLLDDNCDGRVDERLHPQCGVGFCRRESPTCDIDACRPGSPLPEECNLIDDDCNGSVDDGAICGAGKTCVDGTCFGEAVGGGGAPGLAGAATVAGSSGATMAGAFSGGRSSGGTIASSGSWGSSGAPTEPAPGRGGAAAAEPSSSGCNVSTDGRSWSVTAIALVFAILGLRRRAQPGIVGRIGT